MAQAQPSILQQEASGSRLGTVFLHTSSTGTFAIKLIISALHAKDFEVQACFLQCLSTPGLIFICAICSNE